MHITSKLQHMLQFESIGKYYDILYIVILIFFLTREIDVY